MQKRIVILIAVLIALFSVSLTALAETLVMNLRGGDSVEINCDGSKLNLTRINTKKVKAECKGSATAPTNTPVPPTNTPVPQATNTPVPQATNTPTSGGDLAGKECPAWVHDQYVAEGPDGNMYPTWHPPTDPVQGCWFGHEHGSDPNRFPALAEVGMPVFNYTAKQSGVDEPHPGFKVFVIDDHDRDLWWMITFHQGSGNVRRAFVRHHSIDIVAARSSDNTILANVHLMADTGGTIAQCDSNPIPGTGSSDSSLRKVIPRQGCDNLYESWPAKVVIGNLFKFQAGFDLDNAITALMRLSDGSYSQTESVYIASFLCPGVDPFDPTSDCNRIGDKRQVIQPRLTIANTSGNGDVWTDAFGTLVSAGQGIKQFIHPSVRIDTPNSTNFGNGIDNGDVMIYRALAYCADSNDCNPRNFSDGTVRPPN
jgi:hypothetical protein